MNNPHPNEAELQQKLKMVEEALNSLDPYREEYLAHLEQVRVEKDIFIEEMRNIPGIPVEVANAVEQKWEAEFAKFTKM